MCEHAPPSVVPLHLTGAYGEVHPANKDVKDVFEMVKADFIKKSGVNASQYKVISYTSQVVAGTNYIAKVQYGPNSFAHLKVFNPLPHTKQPPQLTSFQLQKNADDDLTSF